MKETEFKQKFNKWLSYLISQGGSDLHVSAGSYPAVRIDNELIQLDKEDVISNSNLDYLLKDMLEEKRYKKLIEERQVDFSLEKKGDYRYRGNAFFHTDVLSLVLRRLPKKIKTLKELNLPEYLYDFVEANQGLFLVVGPNGQGKSTTLASMIEYVNNNYKKHIITIEDPIEYVYANKECLIEQREVYEDTLSFQSALKSSFREDVDIILVGELRDKETIGMAVTAAETGHIVLGTLHTNDSVQTIDRIIDVFPPHQQGQVRSQLASVLNGVVSQRLLRKVGGGRVPALEVLRSNIAVANLIRQNQIAQIKSVLETSKEEGMVTLERYLADMVNAGAVEVKEAQKHALDVDTFKMHLTGNFD
ncbi:MAG: PilT/PilU family type 4a pilus ATPase [Candidatus Moranbacteria bacterium]|nr:PilT/PilU family type 4a pilus ATPase [Candidatus Moranbacteria bacterium]